MLQIVKRCAKRPLPSSEGCQTHPDHSVEYFAEGRRAIKAVKALRGLLSRPILNLGFFKANVTTRYRQEVVKKSSLKVHKNENFFGFDFEFCAFSMLVMHK